MPTNQLSRIIASTDLGDAATWVGQPGTIFWDTATSTIRVSDGATAGGIAIGGGASLGYLALPSRNETQFTIGGGGTLDGIRMTTDRGTIKFGNTPECVPTGHTHFHIMKQDPNSVDLFFGDDFNYLLLPAEGNVVIGIDQGSTTWTFDSDGRLNLPAGGYIGDPFTNGSLALAGAANQQVGTFASGATGATGLQWVGEGINPPAAAVTVNAADISVGGVGISAASSFSDSGSFKTWLFTNDGNVSQPTPTHTTLSTTTGYLGLPQIVSNGGVLTVTAADQGRHIVFAAENNMVFTMTSNSDIPFDVGTTIMLVTGPTTTLNIIIQWPNEGDNDTIVLAGVGTSIDGSLSGGQRTLAPYGMATLIKIAATTWMISGVGLT